MVLPAPARPPAHQTTRRQKQSFCSAARILGLRLTPGRPRFQPPRLQSVSNTVKAKAQMAFGLFTGETFVTFVSNLKQVYMDGFFRKIANVKEGEKRR